MADSKSSLTCTVDGGGPDLGVKWYLDDSEVAGEDIDVVFIDAVYNAKRHNVEETSTVVDGSLLTSVLNFTVSPSSLHSVQCQAFLGTNGSTASNVSQIIAQGYLLLKEQNTS